MSTARGIFRGLLIFIALICTAAWVSLFTLQQTVLNRTVVFGWLNNSGFYSHFVDTVVQLQASPQTGGGDGELNVTALQQAVNQTLTPDFIKQSAETILGNLYDWAEGKREDFGFIIPLDQKKADLQAQLAKALEPQLASLPKCTSKLTVSDTPDCVPAGVSPSAMAADLAARAMSSTDFLSKPLTANDLGQNFTQPLMPARLLATNLPWMVLVLPALAVLCVVGYVLLDANKFNGLGMAGRRLLFATMIGLLTGAAMWMFGKQIAFGDTLGDARIVGTLVDPIIQQVVPDVGKWLTIATGSVVALGGLLWIVSFVLKKLYAKPHLPTPKAEKPTEPLSTPGTSGPTGV